VEKEKRKSLVVLESLEHHPKKFCFSFTGNGEPLKSTDQQRHDCCSCTVIWQNDDNEPEKGKIRG